MVYFQAHPLGGVARFVLTGGSQDVLGHGGGEVRRSRTSLQTGDIFRGTSRQNNSYSFLIRVKYDERPLGGSRELSTFHLNGS